MPAAAGSCRAWSATPARAGWRCWRRTCRRKRRPSWGLIWRCVDDNALIYEARRICEHFAIAPTKGLALIKRALDASAGNSLDAQLDLERDLQREAGLNPDYRRGRARLHGEAQSEIHRPQGE